MRFVLPLALLGCAPDTLHSLDSPDDMQQVLIDLPRVHFAERATPAGVVRGRLTHDGPELTGSLYPTTEPLPVVDALDDVGVLWQDHRVQLVVWLPRHGLETVPVVPTWTGVDRGVRLPAGLPLETESTRSGVWVFAENEAVSVEAILDPADVDQVWFDDPEPQWTPEPDGAWMWALAGVELLDAPLGEPIGTIAPWRGASGDETLGTPVQSIETVRGHHRVQFDADGWPVDAWIHEDDLSMGPSGWGLHASGFSIGCGMRGIRTATVRAQAPLYVEPGGAVVGRTLEDAALELDGAPGDWRGIEVRTPWGTAPLWVDPADVLP